jgi:CRP-like cAMP-binding protein
MTSPDFSAVRAGTTSRSTVYLLDVDPDIAEFLSSEERAEAHRVTLPVRELEKGPVDVSGLLEATDAFAGVLVSGMLVQRLRVGEQIGLRLLGPGDVLSLTRQPGSMLISHAETQVVAAGRLALLGREVLLAAHHMPRLLAGLHVRVAEQTDRLAAQLVICQLPRVDQRLLAILWLLAESWGQVTPAGTSLPLTFTHDVLGGMVGARRSTVTLALGELSERGALVRQDRGWLLLEPPPSPSEPPPEVESPRLQDDVELLAR